MRRPPYGGVDRQGTVYQCWDGGNCMHLYIKKYDPGANRYVIVEVVKLERLEG